MTAIAGPPARFGRSLAVIIGIDTYGEGIAPLRSAVADARAIAEVLQRDHGFESWCLFDDDAGLAQLLALVRERLPRALGPEDRLLFYFAGHGIALDGDSGPAGYLVPARATRAQRDGFLPMHVLHDELVRLPVRHALIVLDCCFAGTFRWSSLRDVEPAAEKIYRERYDRYIESPAWQVLTSASNDQLALDMLANDRGEGASAHSPFALALLEALAGGADYTRDNLITADELALYVRDRVAPAAESVRLRQVPQLFPLELHQAGQFVFQVPNRPLELAFAPELDEDANPYRGLRSFHEENRALFFGREPTTRRLVEAVTARALTVVVGPSGCGKSSLVHAGLVPALRAQGWTVLPAGRPGREPRNALDAWTRALGAATDAGAVEAAWVAAATERARAAPEHPWLVIADQFEELLTHRTAEADRAAFLDALAAALRAAPNLHLVVTVRSDVEPQLQDTALAPWWTAARFTVPAMTRDELRLIIERPAIAKVLHFEPPRLIERLLDDVALVPAPLPLLSFALSELYRRCWTRWRDGARDRSLREADYDEMGSVARALTQRATAVHDELVAEDAAYAVTIRNIFTRMVAIVGGEIARRRAPRDELAYGDPAEDRRVADALQRFHDARLISLAVETHGERGASACAEPTHDELVRGWTKVSQWLDELDDAAGTRVLLAALGDAVRSWKANGRATLYLWSDLRIVPLRVVERAHPFVFNADEACFVNSSVRRRRLRYAGLIGGVLGVIVVLAVAAGIALRQRDRADRSAADATRQRDIAAENAERANRYAISAAQEARRASEKAEEATREARRANQNAVEAKQERNEAIRLVAQSQQETGRQLLLDGRPQEAIPYLLAARQNGEDRAPLRMLFSAAARALPLMHPLEHRGPVHSAAFSPDGTRILTAAWDGTARIWSAATGKQLASLHVRRTHSASFSANGARIVTECADLDGTGYDAHVWDAGTGKLLAGPFNRSVGSTSALSPDGTRLVTTSKDNTAGVWDATTGKLVAGPFGSRVRDAAFSPDSTRVMTTSFDGPSQIWDAVTGELRVTLLGHDVNGATFSPDGTRIVTMSGDRSAHVWDTATGTHLAGPLGHEVFSAAFTPDGTRIVTMASHQVVRVWDAATGKPLAALNSALEDGSFLSHVEFSPDGARVVIARYDAAQVWDVATGTPAAPAFQHQGSLRRIAFSPDGTRIVTASDDGTAQIWSASTGKPVARSFQHQGKVSSAAFSPDGTRIVTGSEDGTARIWSTEETSGLILDLGPEVKRAAFSPDGTRIVTVDQDGTMGVWNAATGAQIGNIRYQLGKVTSVAFSRDGTNILLASHGGTVWVWSVAGGELVARLQHDDKVNSAAFSPDGARIVTASDDGHARIWRTATGDLLSTLRGHEVKVNRAAFSPDGRRVVTAGDTGAARVWDAVTGKTLALLSGHRDRLYEAAFSPDGTRVVTASSDHTARVWDAITGRPITDPLAHGDVVWAATFSPDGARIVTASRDRTARVWNISTGKPDSLPLEHRGDLNSAGFSSDGTRVVTASADGSVRIWDTATGKPLALLIQPSKAPTAVNSAEFSPDGMRVVTASDDGTARVWELGIDRTSAATWAEVARRSPFAFSGGNVRRKSSVLGGVPR